MLNSPRFLMSCRLNVLPTGLDTSAYSADACCLMDARSHEPGARRDIGDNLGFAHELRKRIREPASSALCAGSALP